MVPKVLKNRVATPEHLPLLIFPVSKNRALFDVMAGVGAGK